MTRHGLIACAYVALAMMLGGGGSPNPGTEAIVQLGFGVAAIAWV